MDDPYVAPVLQEPGIIPLTLLYLMSHSNHSNNHSGTFSSLVENTWDVQYKQYKYIYIRLPVQPESTRRTCLWSSFEILQQNQNYRQSFHLVSIKGNLQIIRYNVGDDWVNLFAMCSYHSGSNACSVRQNSRDGESAHFHFPVSGDFWTLFGESFTLNSHRWVCLAALLNRRICYFSAFAYQTATQDICSTPAVDYSAFWRIILLLGITEPTKSRTYKIKLLVFSRALWCSAS